MRSNLSDVPVFVLIIQNVQANIPVTYDMISE